MRITTSGVECDAAEVRAFDGREDRALSDEDLLEFVRAVATLKKRADVLLAIGGAEVRRRDESRRRPEGPSRRHGKPTARRLIAEELGGSENEAEKLIQVGTMLGDADDARERRARADARATGGAGPSGDEHHAGEDPAVPAQTARPLVAAAVTDGRLSKDKAAAIIDGLERIGERGEPGLEAELVAKGEALSLHLLLRAIDTAVAALDRKGLQQKQEAQHRARSVRVWESRDGVTRIAGELDPVTAAPVRALLEGYVKDQLAARRDLPSEARDDRTQPQMNADGLATMARHMLGCNAAPVRATAVVVVRADRRELEAELGVGESDQLATPLSGQALRALACGAGVMPALSDGRSLPLDLGAASRYFSPAQRLALLERDGGCAICHAPPSWCEAHHIVEASRGGPSDLANGVMLCTACHHRVHRDRWRLEIRGDDVWIHPPPHIDPGGGGHLGGREALRVRAMSREPAPTTGSRDAA